ncbi:Uncharacterised protein [uncultured archaeon]|nr:Uncharacterised protein [uncultured archaeon]
MAGNEFFDPEKLSNMIHHARMDRKTEVALLNDFLYVPWFYRKIPDMGFECRRCYDIVVFDPQLHKRYTFGKVAIDHYVGDGDGDYDRFELLRLKIGAFELSNGRIPDCIVEISAFGERPERKDYERSLFRRKPADLSSVLPTEWFLANRVVSS